MVSVSGPTDVWDVPVWLVKQVGNQDNTASVLTVTNGATCVSYPAVPQGVGDARTWF